MTSGTDSVSSRPSKSTVRRRWKAVELRLAKLLGGERVPVTGRQRGYAPDIEHPWLAIEVKSWARMPERVVDAMDQAEKAAVWAKRRQGVDKLPVAIIHGNGQHFDNALIVMRLGEFRDRFGDGRMADIEVAE